MEEGKTKKFTVFIGVFGLNNRNETPEEKRERLRQEELNKNPYVLHHQPEEGSLEDLIGDIGWNVTGILIIVIIVASVLKFFI